MNTDERRCPVLSGCLVLIGNSYGWDTFQCKLEDGHDDDVHQWGLMSIPGTTRTSWDTTEDASEQR